MNVEVKRSKRKSVSIEVNSELCVIVRVPIEFPQADIDKILLKYSEWITGALEQRRARNQQYPEPTQQMALELKEKAKVVIPKKVEYYSKLTGLVPAGIKITSAKKRFGSCSGKNSLCFSYLLMQYPDECIDYVVLHEIAHIKHRNHSRSFYAFVEQYMPDYRERLGKLK